MTAETYWRTASYCTSAANCVEAAAAWRTSSHSNSQGSCTEVSPGARTVRVRDTKDRDRGQVTVSGAVWEVFLDSLPYTTST